VAEHRRRDVCPEASGSGDLAADVAGNLPGGCRLVVQVKHYAGSSNLSGSSFRMG